MITDALSRDLSIPKDYIQLIARTASHRYKTYFIPKRNKGWRKIDHPARELKLLQTWLSENIFSCLPVHDSVYSYKNNTSTRDHADKHRSYNYLLRVDFRDFFPSILDTDIRELLLKNSDIIPFELRVTDYNTITSVVCKGGKLTIGAPSSPTISNAILYDFDTYWAEYCLNNNIVYTRYADDLFFSTNTPNLLASLYESLKTDIKSRNLPKLSINHEKTIFTSRKRLRRVTGIVLTSDKKISLGRTRKRWVKSMIYRFSTGALNKYEISKLKGYLAYVESIEPDFYKKLENKYEASVIQSIKSSPTYRTKGK